MRARFISALCSACEWLHPDDLEARIGRVAYHVVDADAIDAYGEISSGDGFVAVGLFDDRRFMDSTFVHEMMHAVMGAYVERDNGFTLRHWLNSHRHYEGCASECERFVEGANHDGTNPYPRERRGFQDWLRQLPRSQIYRALMQDIEPRDDAAGLIGSDQLVPHMLARASQF